MLKSSAKVICIIESIFMTFTVNFVSIDAPIIDTYIGHKDKIDNQVKEFASASSLRLCVGVGGQTLMRPGLRRRKKAQWHTGASV